MNSLRLRIFLLFCGLLVAIEAVTLATLYTSMREQVQRGIDQQLDVGREVFLAQFESRRRHLSIYSQVIAKDFGLLSSLHDDPRSLQVALDNHRKRVGADLAIVTDMDGRVLADTGTPADGTGAHLPFAATGSDDARSHFLRHGDRTYQLVAAPLLAPNPVGRLYLGFVIDDALARQFESITSLKVSFVSRAASDTVIASTLPLATHAPLLAQLAGFGTARELVGLGDDEYVSLAVPLEGDLRHGMVALLQQSEGAALAAYRPWWTQVAEVAALVLLAGFGGAWLLARRIVEPVRLLARQADAIAGGNYEQNISIHEKGEIGELVRAFNQMRSAIAERESSIRYNAYHDSLTGLVNRYRLERLIDERASRAGAPRFAVVVLDLNRFKDINDTLGHHAGDRLLREVAARLAATVADQGVAARLGGDEFGVLLDDVGVASLPERLEALHLALREPFAEDELTLHLGAGAGVAVFPEHGQDAATLLRHADAARFIAKERRVRHEIYDGAQDRYSLLRVSLLGEMQAAMRNGDMQLHFQPKLDLVEDAVIEAEALLRWRHPVYGMIPPHEFVPMAEHTGNIHELTGWVIEAALRQAAEWSRQGIELRLAVNISAHDLRNPALLDCLHDSLRRTHTQPAQLKLEITESAVVENETTVFESLQQLHELGIALAIDDYGTGYSSLAQLKRLPVNEIKIDKSFVMALERSNDDEIIVRSTIELGHLMGLDVCAEGVESAAALRLLKQLGCQTAQGFEVARPMPAAEFAAWFRARGWLASAAQAAERT